MISLFCAVSNIPASASSYNYFYTPETISGISGRAYANSDCPRRLLNMSVFGGSANAISQSVTGWNLGDFTGVTSPSPLGTYQLGIDNSWYGSTAVQMTSTEMGAQLHTYSIPSGNGNLLNAQVKYTWDYSDDIRPWQHTTSKLNFSFNLKIPSSYFEGGACGYIYASILLTDPAGHYFWIQPQIYDSRREPGTEYVGWDAGTNSAYANTYYRYGNNGVADYCTKNSASYWSTGSTWSSWRWYGFSVSRTQLLNAINDINSAYHAGLSTNPADWRMTLFSIQDEIYHATGNGHLAFGVKDIWAFEEY
jgi:hypothetical protein